MRKPVRIWVDGCFDMMHFGHSNALRQAKEMGDFLIVGVHSDAEIAKHKGPTVMTETERYAAVAACKWVDEVVPGAPYITSVDYLLNFNCDFCVHGDDITTAADGSDCYAAVKAAGLYRECKRTQGVSTSELVGRMLLMNKEHLQKGDKELLGGGIKSDLTKDLSNLQTLYQHFQSSPRKSITSKDIVVYVDGGFDLFHVGHAEFLREAKKLGTHLIVGLHHDEIIHKIKGSNYPIMNLNERVLEVLSCKHVDDIVIGAPYSIDAQTLQKFHHIDLVLHGSTAIDEDVDENHPYKLPIQMGIYKQIESPMPHLTTEHIINRILQHRKLYEARNRRKAEKANITALTALQQQQNTRSIASNQV